MGQTESTAKRAGIGSGIFVGSYAAAWTLALSTVFAWRARYTKKHMEEKKLCDRQVTVVYDNHNHTLIVWKYNEQLLLSDVTYNRHKNYGLLYKSRPYKDGVKSLRFLIKRVNASCAQQRLVPLHEWMVENKTHGNNNEKFHVDTSELSAEQKREFYQHLHFSAHNQRVIELLPRPLNALYPAMVWQAICESLIPIESIFWKRMAQLATAAGFTGGVVGVAAWASTQDRTAKETRAKGTTRTTRAKGTTRTTRAKGTTRTTRAKGTTRTTRTKETRAKGTKTTRRRPSKK